MNSLRTKLIAISAGILIATGQAAMAETVKITPLGSHDGRFCLLDRALILEDPDGTRLLYDPGVTVRGPDDPRLGYIDGILVSHMHWDHVGDAHQASEDAGECGNPDRSVDALPNTNTVNIAKGVGAPIVTGSEMPSFFASKLNSAGGNPSQSRLVRFGASIKLGGVTITTVPAAHSNGIRADIVGGDLGELLEASGLTASAGPPTGFVLTFSNGLVVYLSGDTGVTPAQETVVRDQYHAKLVVINIGDTFTTGPQEAAFVVNKLIKPKSVIPSHANEVATAEDGSVQPGTKTERFIDVARMPVYVPLSGKTREFNNKGKCVVGC